MICMRMCKNDPVETADIGVQQLCATVRRRVDEHARRTILNQDRRPPSTVLDCWIAIAPIRPTKGTPPEAPLRGSLLSYRFRPNGTREQAKEIIGRGDRNVCLGQSFQFRHLAGRVSDIRGFVACRALGPAPNTVHPFRPKAVPLEGERLSPAVRLPS